MPAATNPKRSHKMREQLNSTPVNQHEKESLDLHVDLCAQRYKNLCDNLEQVSTDIDRLKEDFDMRNRELVDYVHKTTTELKDMIHDKDQALNSKVDNNHSKLMGLLMRFGLGLLGLLGTGVITLMVMLLGV